MNREREKLVQVLYDEVLPPDLIKREQQRISAEIAQIKVRLDQVDTMLTSAQQAIEDGLHLVSVSAGKYGRYSPETRRKFNKAIFEAHLLRGEAHRALRLLRVSSTSNANRHLFGRRFD